MIGFVRKGYADSLFRQRRCCHAEFMLKGTTINTAAYCAILRKAIEEHLPGKLSKKKFVLPHDITTPHSANTAQDLLEKFKWDV